MKVTPQTHPDYASLEKTYERLSDFVNVVNENSREANNMKALREIEGSLSGADVCFPSSLFPALLFLFPRSAQVRSTRRRKSERKNE